MSALFGPEGLRTSCNLGKDEEDLFRYVLKTSPDDLVIVMQQAVEDYERQADQRRLPP